jgi:hypothetical protein
MVEQRRFERFEVRKGALVEVGPAPSIVGLILDISIDGLSFQYIDVGKRPGRSSCLDMKLDDDWLLKKVPFFTISDIEIPVEIPFGCIHMRRSGIQFQALSIKQLSNLAYFIKNNAKAPSAPSTTHFFK